MSNFGSEAWDRDKQRIADNLDNIDVPARSGAAYRRMKTARQATLDLVGGAALIPDRMYEGELGAGDGLPPGPYVVGLTRCEGPDGFYESIPWCVRCGGGDGPAVAGHVPSQEIAEALAAALNLTFQP